MRFCDLPTGERPRERLERLGSEALAERELLALVLGSADDGALDVASALLAEFGGLAALSRAWPEELRRVHGVGPAEAAALVAAFRLGRLAAFATDDAPVLRRPEDAARIALRELAGLRRERVIVLVCDAGNRLRHVVTVAEGSIDRAPFPVREILSAVLRHDGKAFAVAHNHPGGRTDWSAADVAAERALRQATRQIGLRLLGCLVVAGDAYGAVRKPVGTRG